MSRFETLDELNATSHTVLGQNGIESENISDYCQTSEEMKHKKVMDLTLDSHFFVRLRNEVLGYLEAYPPIGFVNQLKGLPIERLSYYLGRGVTYNPRYKTDFLDEEQVLGIPRPNVGSIFNSKEGEDFYEFLLREEKLREFFEMMRVGASYAKKKMENNTEYDNNSVKNILNFFDWESPENNIPFKILNSYSDSWGFSEFTPLGNLASIQELIKKVGLSIVRSRVATLKSSLMEDHDFDIGWHIDDSYLVELRLYIPLQGGSNYFLEDANSGRFIPKEGHAYIWDTLTPHRANAFARVPNDRHSLILGLSPWFLRSGDIWRKNQYFGKHPFDIFSQIQEKSHALFTNSSLSNSFSEVG